MNAPRSALALLALAAGTLAACKPTYDSAVPFTCVENIDCPSGFSCLSTYCVRDDAGGVPNQLQRSTAVIAPVMRVDRDRNGLMSCWTRDEENDNPLGSAYGAFLAADGSVSETVRLATFDTRGAQPLIDCAPIPNSGGKVLVAAWVQRFGTATIQLAVWSPDTPNGFTGTTSAFYSETDPDPSLLIPQALEMTIVGDRAWVPFSAPLRGTNINLPTHRMIRLAVGAAELAAGAPQRDEIVRSIGPSEYYFARFIGSGSPDGAFLVFSSLFMKFGFVAADSTRATLRDSIPSGQPGFSIPLAARTIVDPTTPQQFAMLWPDPVENAPTIGTVYRVAWGDNASTRLTLGPTLPFERIYTTRPASFEHNGSLYIFGTAPAGTEIAPRPLDAAMDDAAVDATVAETGAAGDASTAQPAPLVMYRMPWLAGNGQPVETVRTIPRILGDSVVPAASAAVMPDGTHFGLVWSEYYPQSPGHGARYALYMSRFEL